MSWWTDATIKVWNLQPFLAGIRCIPVNHVDYTADCLPSTDPTMTAPSSYTMQIFWPSAFQLMLLTTDLFRLLIISSYHAPLNGAKTNNSLFLFHYLWPLILLHRVTWVWHSPNDGQFKMSLECGGKPDYSEDSGSEPRNLVVTVQTTAPMYRQL